ncbi:hypothetical protein JCM16814_17390 [Desulfobaculum senezii]
MGGAAVHVRHARKDRCNIPLIRMRGAARPRGMVRAAAEGGATCAAAKGAPAHSGKPAYHSGPSMPPSGRGD